MDKIKASRADKTVKAIVEASFPEYRGRRIRIEPAKSVHYHDLNWSGGTRNEYRIVVLQTLQAIHVNTFKRLNEVHPAINTAEGHTAPLAGGLVVVRHSIFCGKDLGITIYANPDDLAPLLN